MAITYVGGTTATGASADYAVSLTGLTGGSDSAPSENDIVVVGTGFVKSPGDGDPGVTTSGYTEIAELFATDSQDANLSVNWKRMGSTPDTSVTVKGSGNAGEGAATVVHVWRGVNTTTAIDATTTTATLGNSSQPDGPAITPTTAGAVVINVSLVVGSQTSTVQISTLTGYDNVRSTNTDPGVAVGVGIASKAWSGSGAEDPGTWGGNTATGVACWCSATLALRPVGQSFSVSETATLTETITNTRARLFSISETATLTESISSALGKMFSVIESVSLAETFNSTRSLIFGVAESVGLTEVLIRLRERVRNLTKHTATGISNRVKGTSSIKNKSKS